MCQPFGAKIEMDYAMAHFAGKSLKSNLEHVENLIGIKLPDYFEKEFRKRTFKSFKANLEPIKGIHELLEKIAVPFCVASSGPQEKIQLNLTTVGLIEKFENRIFSSYDINSWKPNPEIFEYAAKTMGFKPNECVVIEDSLAGVKAAKNGGFDVFGFANNHNHAELKKEGATVFFDMEHLYGLL